MVGLEFINEIIEKNEDEYRVLNKEEQTNLFKEYEKAKGTDREIIVRNKIANHNIRMVFDLMPKAANIHTEDRQDMFSYGYMGLLHAIELYDYKKEDGAGFYTYASYWVKREIQQFIMHNRFVRIPQHLYPYVIKVEGYCNDCLDRTGRIPPLKDVLANCQLSNATYTEEAYYNYLYGQKRVLFHDSTDEDERTSFEKLESSPDTNVNIEKDVVASATSERIHFIINEVLQGRELEITKNLYGLNEEGRCISGTELAKRYGITKQRVNQLFNQAKRKLKYSKYGKELRELCVG